MPATHSQAVDSPPAQSGSAEPSGAIRFAIDPRHDPVAIADTLARDGRVRIADLLGEGAIPLLESLWYRQDWIHLISAAGGAIELHAEAKAALDAGAWEAIESAAAERAQTGFQYRYEALRVPLTDGASDPEEPLDAFARFLASDDAMQFLSTLLQRPLPLTFTDGQATAYGCGDFLTAHDDNVTGRRRVAAFVCGLTPAWRTEWGGLLLFHDNGQVSATGYIPQFNTLDLFTIPQMHSVSMVTPSAMHRRLAITGWISEPAP